MADESLGELSVSITGDFSELSTAIEQATSEATQGATAIAGALNVSDAGDALAASITGIGDAATAATSDVVAFARAASDSASGAEELNTAADPLATGLESVGSAATTAGTSVAEFGSESGTAATGANEAESGVQGLAEQFVALGEALVATEALKEFGQEALTAFGTVQSVTIGLTQLTGSAEQADEIITQVKDLAATEPFAFPEIAPTIQKMVALGVSAAQIPTVMQSVADAAAATGNSFQQVANSFDRMTLSGTVSARTLVQLGISTAQMGTAMGVSADQVKAAFLAMDQSQRIDVLESAMVKFAGSAEAQAQGISGAWQIFQNQFEEVMVGVGEALTPVVQSMLEFTKGLLGDAQEIIGAFNELPAPIKDFIVVVGVAAAAIVPLTAAVSAIGFAWIGLQAAGTALTGVMGALGLASGEAAASEAVLATSSTAAGEAIATAEAEISGAGVAAVAAEAGFSALGISFGGLAAVLAGPVIASLLVTKSNLDDLKTKWDEMTQDMLTHSIVQAMSTGDATDKLNALGLSVDDLKNKILNAGSVGGTTWQSLATSMQQPLVAFQSIGISADQVAAKLKGIAIDGIPVFTLLANSPDLATFKQSLETLGGNVDLIIGKLNQLTPAVQGFSGALGITVVGAATFNAGLATLTASQEKLNTAVTTTKGVMDAAHSALQNAVAGTADAALKQQVYNDAIVKYDNAVVAAVPHGKNFSDTVAGITQAMTLAQEKFQSSEIVLNSFITASDGSATSIAKIADAATKAGSAAKAAGDAFASWQGILATAAQTHAQLVASYDAESIAYQKLLDQQAQGKNVTTELAAVYAQWQATGQKLGVTISDTAGEVAILTQKASAQEQAITPLANAYTALAATGDKTEAQMKAMALAFSQIQTDAAGLGLSVQQVGQGLVFTATSAGTATPQLNAYAKELTSTYSGSTQLVDINGKLVPLLQGVAQATNNMVTVDGQLVAAHNLVNGVLVTSSAAVANHTAALNNNANAANIAKQAQIDLGSTYQTVTATILNLTNAGKNQITNLENMVGAFVNLNSTNQTTVAGQIALQQAFKDAQSAGAALGITITATGATANNNATPAVQALVVQLNAAIQAMNAANPAGNQLVSTLNNITSAANSAAGAMGQVAQQVSGALDAIGNGGQGGGGSFSVLPGSNFNIGEPSITGTSFGNQRGQTPIPPDPHPGHDYFEGTTGTWVPWPTVSSSSSSSQGTSSLTTAASSAATAVTALGNASSTVPTPLGAAVTSVSNLTAATNAATTSTTAASTATDAATAAALAAAVALRDSTVTAQVATTDLGRFATSLSTSVAASDLAGSSFANLTTEQTAYYTAAAASTNAQNAYTNALSSGTATAASLAQLGQAAQDAAVAMRNLAGGSNVGTGSTTTPFAGYTTLPLQATGLVGTSNNFGSPYAPNSTIGQGNPVGQGVTINVNLNAGTVVGNNAAGQLADMVAPQIVAKLRQAGVKL